jgi:hypothetical protein
MKRMVAAGMTAMATLSLTGAALAGTVFETAGTLNPNQAKVSQLTLSGGEKFEVKVEGNHHSRWRVQVFERVGPQFVLIKDKSKDDDDIEVKFEAPATTTYAVVVRNISNQTSPFELKIKD